MEPEYDYLQFDHDFQPWWQRRVGRWLIGVGLVLLVVGGMLVRPGWRVFREWRADREARRGEQLLREGRLAEAHDRALEALRWNERGARQLQLMAEVIGRVGATSGLEYWRRLLELPGATDDQRRGMVAFALDRGRTRDAEEPLRRLLAVTDPPARTWLLAARHHAMLNDVTNALNCAREVQRRAASEPEPAMDLAQVLAALPEPECRRTAEALRWSVARGTSPLRWEAIRALVVDRDGDVRARREEVIRMLAESTESRAVIAVADARMRLDPASAREIALEALSRLQPKTDDELRWMQRWLHEHELFGRAVETLPAARAQHDLELVRLRYTGLVGVGQASAAYRESLRPNPALDEMDQELDRLHLAMASRDEAAAANHQRRVLELAHQNSVRLRRVAEYAEFRGLVPLAISTWKALAGDRLETRRALRSLIALTDGTGDTWAAREAARRLALLEPDDVHLALRVAHYDLLLGENLATALSTADGLVDHPSAGREARFVAALADVRLGRFREARAYLSDPLRVGQNLRSDLRSIGVAVLGASGDTDRARTLAGTLTGEKLRPEEQELIRAYR